MQSTFDLKEMGQGIVYVRPVDVSDLPADMQDQAEGRDVVFAVHNHEGERLALVADRNLAFALAVEHEMQPVTLH